MSLQNNVATDISKQKLYSQILLNGALMGGSFLGIRYLAGADKKRRKKFSRKVPQHIPTTIKDYSPGIWTPELDEGTVDCNLEYMLNNDCDLSQPLTACKSCKGLFSCQRTEDDVVYKDPNSAQSFKIPMPSDKNRGRCLPIKDDFSCNMFSGNVILSKRGGVPFWFCDPKYPSLISKFNYFGDVVNDSKACNGGTLVDPVSLRPWRDTMDFEPIYGTCKCPEPLVPGEKGPADTFLNCINDPCNPGTRNANGGCNCPRGYVQCGEGAEAFESWELQYHCPGAVVNNTTWCVPDPCGPLGEFKYGKCVAKPAYDRLLTRIEKTSDNNIPRRGHLVRYQSGGNVNPETCPPRR